MNVSATTSIISPYASRMAGPAHGPGATTPDAQAPSQGAADGVELGQAALPEALVAPSPAPAEEPCGGQGLARVMRGVAMATAFGAVALGATGCAAFPMPPPCHGWSCGPVAPMPMPMPYPAPVPLPIPMPFPRPMPFPGHPMPFPGGPHHPFPGGHHRPMPFPGGHHRGHFPGPRW